MDTKKQTDSKSSKSKIIVPKTASERQRFKLEKLMSKPDKPVVIPECPDPKNPRVFNPPEFIRNIWGSSAGAGSGDFHVYRGVRRREYARQKFINEKAEQDRLDDEFKEQFLEKKRHTEEKTAKKRAKRLKKKAKQKAKKMKLPSNLKQDKDNESSSDEDEEETEEGSNKPEWQKICSCKHLINVLAKTT